MELIKTFRTWMRRQWRWLTFRRWEKPASDTCRGRIDKSVREIQKRWKVALDRNQLQLTRDFSIHAIRKEAKALLREVGN